MNSPSTVSAASGSSGFGGALFRPHHLQHHEQHQPGDVPHNHHHHHHHHQQQQQLAERQHSHAGASTSGQPPQSVFWNFPVTGGSSPQARWACASAAVGKLVWVFGGMASSVMEDLWLLDVDTMVWRPLVPTCSRPKDKPEKMHAAAMCSTGSTLWLFGGQQGRKYLRTLYSLDTETLSWRMCNPAGAAPPGRAGHTLTAVADHAVYLFGGQGKKLYNDLYVMHGDGGDWLELKPSGKAPAPRTGHTMVWDGKDRLIVFGGTAGSNTDNGVFVYSLSSNQWSMPTVSGMLPSSRTHHTAVMLPGAAHMLVFGGCNAQGTFFNDVYILDVHTFTWSRPQQLNPAPPPRYHHCCFSIDSKVLIYGGINTTQAFEGVVVLETNFGTELSAVADELFKMSAAAGAIATGGPTMSRGSGSSSTGGTGTAGSSSMSMAGMGAGGGAAAAGAHPLVSDLMKLQLRDLLVKRNMEEMHVSAGRKAEQHETRIRELTAEKTALHRDLLQARLVLTETEEANQRLQQELAEATKGLAAEQAESERLRGSLREARGVMSAQRVQLAEARQLLEGMSCELGILSSRYNRTLEENTALRGARKRRPWREQQQQQQQQAAPAQQAAAAGAVCGPQQQQQQPPLGDNGAVAAAAQEAVDQVRPGTPPSAATRGGDDGMLEHALPQTPCGAEAAAQRLVLTHGPAHLTPSSSLLQASPATAPAAAAAAAAPGVATTSSISSEGASSGGRSRVSSSSGSSGADDDSFDTAEDNTEIMSWLAGGGSSSPAAARAAQQPLAQQPAVPHLTLPSLVRGGASSGNSGGLQVSTSPAGPPLHAVCPHGHPDQGSCLACMCQRYLAHTAEDNAALAPAEQCASSSSGSLVPGDGRAAGLASEPATADGSAAQLQAPYQQQVLYKDLLHQADSQRAALQQEVAALQVQLQGVRTEVQEMSQHLDQLQGRGSALARCSVSQLQQLEALLESSARSVRAAMLQRTIEEQRKASADSHMCSACHQAPRCMVLGCGHQTCSKCGESAQACPLCSAPVATRIWLSG